MQIEVIKNIAIATQPSVLIHTVQDALDLMADAKHLHDCTKIILCKEHLPEEFFQLSTGFAGEILQKYVNYGVKLAVVGDFSGYTSKALRDFIRESNRGTHVFFLPTQEEAIATLEHL